MDLGLLKEAIVAVCNKRRLVADGPWLEKVVQLYQIQTIHHGLMMVGPSGSGKSTAHQVLLEALHRVEGIEGTSYIIDPKAMSKESLYGHMEATTREWTDGLFTHILRKIVDNARGEAVKRHWIIFDGDVDPEWVENLNSVLDDNRLLTLPNGERLNLPSNVRIMFEVEDLKQATLATVSRCGMVWFSDDTVTLDVAINHYLDTLRNVVLNDAEEDIAFSVQEHGDSHLHTLETQRIIAEIFGAHMKEGGMVMKAMDFVEQVEHIMDFTRTRAFAALCTLLNSIVRRILEYNASHPDFPMNVGLMDIYATKQMILALVWSLAGDSKLETRARLAEFLRGVSTVDFPGTDNIIEFDVSITTGEWVDWRSKVPTIEIETHNVAAADVVIPTVDTVRHEEVLYSWLSEHKPLILCGPPGSGKVLVNFPGSSRMLL